MIVQSFRILAQLVMACFRAPLRCGAEISCARKVEQLEILTGAGVALTCD